MKTDKKIKDTVIELLELSRISSPFAASLHSQYRTRLIDRLLKTNRIDQETADYLLAT